MQEGQRVLMFSYGSGLASTIFSFKIREGQHPFTISNIAEVMDLESKLESRNEVCFCILLDICDIIIMLRANLKHFKYVFFQDNRCSTIFKIICSFNFIIWASRNQEQHYLTNVAESELQETKNKIIFIFCCAICLRRKWLLFAFIQRS